MGSWKELNQSLAGMKRKTVAESNEAETASNYDPYDMLVKSLGFEKKEARGGERLKTDDEKIKDEKERLEKLEEDRLRRMRGEKAIGKTQYTTMSRRLCPELLSAILGLLYVAGSGHKVRPQPPCKGGVLLLLSKPASENQS